MKAGDTVKLIAILPNLRDDEEPEHSRAVTVSLLGTRRSRAIRPGTWRTGKRNPLRRSPFPKFVGQSGTAEVSPRCENAFGSTPETRGKLGTPPTAIHEVQPKYPSAAKKSHIEGMVVLCVTIGKDGDVRSVSATSGPKELIPAAVQAFAEVALSALPCEQRAGRSKHSDSRELPVD